MPEEQAEVEESEAAEFTEFFTRRRGATEGNGAALSAAFHKYGAHRGRRGARLARREEGEYREYVTDEQRREAGAPAARSPARWDGEAGCIGGRMPPYLWKSALSLLGVGPLYVSVVRQRG